MSEKINYMDPKELLSSGLLFAINQKVLHPLGLALEVVVEDDGSAHVGGVWDYREDPEGMLFDEDTFRAGEDKYERYMKERGDEAHSARERAIGFVVQRRGAAARLDERR